MRLTLRLLTLAAVLAVAAPPLLAQEQQGLTAELSRDLSQVEKKIMDLARAMPESAWNWRPSAPARTTSEVFMHIAADNYLLPAMVGAVPPAETGITKEYKTAVAFEKRTLSKDAAIAELEKSFAFLRQSLAKVDDAQLAAPVDFFGQKATNRYVWLATSGHLHEHLGQLIAYARSNNITPPWSK